MHGDRCSEQVEDLKLLFLSFGKLHYFQTSILPFTWMVHKELFCSRKTNRTDRLICQKRTALLIKRLDQIKPSLKSKLIEVG